MADTLTDHEPWPLRAAGLAALGLVLAVIFDRLLNEGQYRWTEDPLRLAAAAFVAVAGIAFGFTLERVRPLWSATFGIAAGLIVALVFTWNGSPDGWSAGDGWRIFAALLVVAIAAPLFQAARDQGRARLDYAPIHAHAWTNIVLWCAAWAFVLISWLLANLLAELFNLIGIDLLKDALRESWFTAAIVGAALGGAIGLLRDRDAVLSMLQRVVTTVLSVLAPILALGLALFVLALPFTGLGPLWAKTSATTPILLFAVAGAFLLVNAVIGNAPEEEAKGRALRLSAMALAAVMAPLAIVAAISTWLRIDQYGFTPERLWAATFVILVLAIALAYLWTVVRARRAWSDRVRPLNVVLALGICAVASLLATPLINFGAISTRDQLARLESGRVKPDEFDWAALRFDFGPKGREAISRLAREGRTPGVMKWAQLAKSTKDKFALQVAQEAGLEKATRPQTIRVRPAQVPIPADLSAAILSTASDLRPMERACDHPGECILFWQPGDRRAIAVSDGCAERLVGRSGQTDPAATCNIHVTLLERGRNGWQEAETSRHTDRKLSPEEEQAALLRERQALDRGDVQIREVKKLQVFIGDEPVSGLFDAQPLP